MSQGDPGPHGGMGEPPGGPAGTQAAVGTVGRRGLTGHTQPKSMAGATQGCPGLPRALQGALIPGQLGTSVPTWSALLALAGPELQGPCSAPSSESNHPDSVPSSSPWLALSETPAQPETTPPPHVDRVTSSQTHAPRATPWPGAWGDTDSSRCEPPCDPPCATQTCVSSVGPRAPKSRFQGRGEVRALLSCGSHPCTHNATHLHMHISHRMYVTPQHAYTHTHSHMSSHILSPGKRSPLHREAQLAVGSHCPPRGQGSAGRSSTSCT